MEFELFCLRRRKEHLGRAFLTTVARKKSLLCRQVRGLGDVGVWEGFGRVGEGVGYIGKKGKMSRWVGGSVVGWVGG